MRRDGGSGPRARRRDDGSPRRARRTALLAATALLALAAAGCDGGPGGAPRPLFLSWTFVDGRTCTEAAVPFVYVGPPGAENLTRLDCHAGTRQPVAAGDFPPGRLEVYGVSVDGAPLYYAAATVPDTDPAWLSVTLRYVGGYPSP